MAPLPRSANRRLHGCLAPASELGTVVAAAVRVVDLTEVVSVKKVLKRRESRSPGVRLELLERRPDEALILRGEAPKFFFYALFEAERPEHG